MAAVVTAEGEVEAREEEEGEMEVKEGSGVMVGWMRFGGSILKTLYRQNYYRQKDESVHSFRRW